MTPRRRDRWRGCAGTFALVLRGGFGRGTRPDSARWYIERSEDETLGSPAAAAPAPARTSSLRAQPAKSTTWCDVKALYR